MATKRIPILGHSVLPDSSGDVFFETTAVKFTNDRYSGLALIFNNSGTAGGDQAFGSFVVPDDYVGSAVVSVLWCSTATTGTCRFGFSYTSILADGTESADPSTDAEADE